MADDKIARTLNGTAYEVISAKNTNGGYVGRGSSGEASIPYHDFPEQAGATPGADVGRLYGLDVQGKTVMEYRDSAGIVGRVFRDSMIVAQNTSGGTLNKGTVVRVTGLAVSGVPTFSAADSDAAATMPAFGILTENVANNAYGRVMYQGVLTGLNTGGMSAGAALYASGTAGGFTTTPPIYPAFRQVLGNVLSVNASTGEVLVNVAHFFRQLGTPIPVVFFDGDTIAVATGVGRWIATTNMAGTITEVRAAVNTVSSSGNITLSIKKNGTQFTTVTINASANSGSSTGLSTAIAAGDYITVDVTGAGTGVKDLVVVGELMTAT